MHYHQSLDGAHSNYEPFLKQNMILSDSSGGSSSTQSNLRRMKPSIRRSGSKQSFLGRLERSICGSNSRSSSEQFYRRLLVVLLLLILFLLLLVVYLFCKF